MGAKLKNTHCPDRDYISEATEKFLKVYAVLGDFPSVFAVGKLRVDEVRTKVAEKQDRYFEEFVADRDSSAFNCAFFYKNLYKCLLTLVTFKNWGLLKEKRAFDIGCGAGPFAIAWDAVFATRSSEIVLVDSSPRQLDLADEVFKLLEVENYSIQCTDFVNDALLIDGICLASYWQCAQQDRPIAAVASKLFSCQTIVVDYGHVIEALAKAMPKSISRYDLRLRGIDLPISSERLFSDHEINVSSVLFVPS